MILFYLCMSLGAAVIYILATSTRGLADFLILSGIGLAGIVVVMSSIMLPEFTGAPWVPISKDLIRKILDLSQVQPGEVLYDLGSGDGRIVIAAARDFGAKARGIEIDPLRVLYSRLKITQFRLRGKAWVIRKNFFEVDLHDADVVILYLLEKTNDKLQGKLERELKSTSRVVSIVFHLKDWQIIRSDEESRIYVYCPRHPELIS
jgi:precorrin-6B methylase 2